MPHRVKDIFGEDTWGSLNFSESVIWPPTLRGSSSFAILYILAIIKESTGCDIQKQGSCRLLKPESHYLSLMNPNTLLCTKFDADLS
jgi:hypothetical protein